METCMHVWHLAQGGGTVFYRWRRCYEKKQTADAAVRRWKKYSPAEGSKRPAKGTNVFMVRKCDGPDVCGCACHRQAV